MKTMKLFSMAAAALLMAACSNSDDFDVQKPAETAGVYHFEATIAAPDADATMRTVYTEVTESTDPDYKKIKVAWKVGDKIALVHNGVVDEAEVKTVDNVTGKATIEADITGSPSDNDDVYLAYPFDAVASATPDYDYGLPFTPNSTTFAKVRNQDGTLKYIQDNLDLRMGSGQLAVSGSDVTLKESVSIYSLICIWKLTLQDESSNALSATKLTFINNNFIQARATNTSGKSEYYLCVVPSFFPAPSGTFSFEATVGSDTYTFSKMGLSLPAGKYYQSTVKMAKVLTYPVALSAVTADYVGSVVTTDCNVYAKVSEIPAGKTAAAMIAYVSGTGTGLAIALADDGSRDWNSANSTCGGKAAIGGNSWHLPSQAEWKQMFSAFGGNENSYTGLNTAITNAGGTALNGKYWSSSEGGDWDDGYDEANFVELYSGDTFWSLEFKSESFLVRAVLAF